MPLVSDPGYVLVRACVPRAWAGEVLPGPSAALAAIVASACPRPLRSPASCPASAATSARPCPSPRNAGRLRVAAPDRGDARGARGYRPDRPRGVPRADKLHEEVARGTAREIAERYAERAPKGEVVWLSAARVGRRGVGRESAGGPRRAETPGREPERGHATAAAVVAELTGRARTALPGAVAARRDEAVEEPGGG